MAYAFNDDKTKTEIVTITKQYSGTVSAAAGESKNIQINLDNEGLVRDKSQPIGLSTFAPSNKGLALSGIDMGFNVDTPCVVVSVVNATNAAINNATVSVKTVWLK